MTYTMCCCFRYLSSPPSSFKMINNFPLFRLPFVALYEVLDNVELETILPLSFCSKQTKLIMKNYHRSSKKVNIGFDIVQCALKVDDCTLISVMTTPKILENPESVTIGPRRVPVEMEDGILTTYWKDKRVGMAAIIKYALDVFNVNLHSLIARGELSLADVRFWIEWIKKFQVKIHTLSAWLETGHQEKLTKYILESDIVSGDLELLLPDFFNRWYLRPAPLPYSMDVLYLRPASWVTLDHLLAMDIKKICLKNTHLTCKDVNVFLKPWIKGECSKKVKEVFLDILGGIDFAVLFNNIEVTRRDSNSIKYFGYKGSERIVGGFDIRRKSDGAMATIMKKLGGLKILFWPDNEGNPYH